MRFYTRDKTPTQPKATRTRFKTLSTKTQQQQQTQLSQHSEKWQHTPQPTTLFHPLTVPRHRTTPRTHQSTRRTRPTTCPTHHPQMAPTVAHATLWRLVRCLFGPHCLTGQTRTDIGKSHRFSSHPFRRRQSAGSRRQGKEAAGERTRTATR